VEKKYQKNIILGKDVSIGNNCTFEGLKNKTGTYQFGDYTKIHEKCRFYCSNQFKIGDYGVIQNNTLIQGYKPCTIGHNAWIGQNSIINATDSLKIGNNLCIGTDSKIWTHAFHGELLLGSKIAVGIPDYESKSGSISIGDDFWGVGQITISPGVQIGNKVIALTNSLITKNIPDNTIVAGIPAKPIKIDGDFKAYKNLSINEKFDLMTNFSKQFAELKNIEINVNKQNKIIKIGENKIIIDCGDSDRTNKQISYFDFIKRSYTKKHNHLEREFMEFVIGYRARFVPENENN
jgi:acetyltransferase-like isoleucine patch superfamily enzyme|tara:strand:+ start:12519 stop:13394 length:876 start_codon:yes stop_codon:yes gene_type:complete